MTQNEEKKNGACPFLYQWDIDICFMFIQSVPLDQSGQKKNGIKNILNYGLVSQLRTQYYPQIRISSSLMITIGKVFAHLYWQSYGLQTVTISSPYSCLMKKNFVNILSICKIWIESTLNLNSNAYNVSFTEKNIMGQEFR